MTNPQPLVSICVPVYNAEPYLEETLRTAMRQTYENWELVIVENHSKDTSRATIERIAKEAADPRIKVHINETHLGMAANMNRAIALAQGEFVKILCADDTLEPDCIARQAEALIQNPEAVLATCAGRVINSKGRVLFDRQPFSREGIVEGRNVIKECLRIGTNPVGEPTMVLMRASALRGMPLMGAEAAYCVDLDLWLRLLLRGGMFYHRRALASFRIHGQAATRSHEKKMIEDFFVPQMRSQPSLEFRSPTRTADGSA